MAQPNSTTPQDGDSVAIRSTSIKDDMGHYDDLHKPDVKKERYFRCTVNTHPDESAWIYGSDTVHTPLRFHRDVEVILPEWALEVLRAAKFTQHLSKFGPFQKTVPTYPRHTRRFMPDVKEEVTYNEYVAWRDNDAKNRLPEPSDGANPM